MKLLITTAEVAAAVFGGDASVVERHLNDAQIISAQRKFIRPVLGVALYDAIAAGRYTELLEQYLKPALALYVKTLVLPRLAAQPTAMGIMQYGGQNFAQAGEQASGRLLRNLRSEAAALMRACVEYIRERSEGYPEYDPRDNILNRTNIEGGIVL